MLTGSPQDPTRKLVGILAASAYAQAHHQAPGSPPVTQGRACPEPGGREMVQGTGRSAHSVLLDQQGYCPWCGGEDQ
jgi:hypothetical protein